MTASVSRSLAGASALLVAAVGALAGGAASAHDRAGVSVQYGQPVYQAAPQVVVQAPPVVVAHAMPHHRYAHAGAVGGCAAPGWDPRVRYMPGQVVWQGGSLWVATDVSASVWNENSPPEWTPSYWVPAVCR
jgi:hypothetical protein